MATSELQKRPANEVDPYEEPSAEWGWHGTLPIGTRGVLGASAVFCFLMLYGNHQGFTEDIWLVGTGVALLVLLGVMRVRKRTAWRR